MIAAPPRPRGGPGQTKPLTVKKLIGLIVAVAGLITAVTGLVAAFRPVGTSEAIASTRPLAARVVNTWDDEKHRNIGVSRYQDPNSTARVGVGLPEGTEITVLCQDLHGREVHDAPYRDRPLSFTRWDRLSDGTVISDLYTDLPKPPGQPPAGLPECH